jgi:hypothetical protein
MFGAVNALFSGLAFAILIVAPALQGAELKLQREELQHQRTELRLQREEFEKQNQTLDAQRFENTFFQLLRMQADILAAIRFKNSGAISGRVVFSHLRSELEFCYGQVKTYASILDRVQQAYERMYSELEPHVGHYFRHLYHILKFVDDSDVADKRRYAKFVRAQLSSDEQTILFYNCLSTFGENFKPLAEKYALLQTMNQEAVLDCKHLFLYEQSVYGDRRPVASPSS